MQADLLTRRDFDNQGPTVDAVGPFFMEAARVYVESCR
jgi:hypothetical protein